jgi:two-component system, LuxR family, response regulator FixJ
MTASDATVFVVDDNDAMRHSLQVLLHAAHLNVETFSSAEEFLDHHGGDESGCLILDVTMPGMSGTELQTELIARNAGCPIIFLTGHGDVPMAAEAMRHGAVDFLQKPVDGHALLNRVQEAMARDVTTRRQKAERLDAERHLATLTTREHEVLDLMAAGHPTKSIAARLGISQRTVEDHRAHVMRKMGCDSLPALISVVLLVKNHAAAIPSI